MPELPEVETIRRGLASHIVGHQISEVTLLHERSVRKHEAGARDFVATLTGRVFAVPARRGKYLWLPFDNGDALLAHLGMSGQFHVVTADAALVRNTRVVFGLQDGWQLRFVDQRMFGFLTVSQGGANFPTEVTHIARDLLDPELNQNALVQVISQKRTAIKRVLLDQRVVSGIGNIYADETLWKVGLRYDTLACQLDVPTISQLLDAARQVLLAAIAAGGTSFDALYVGVDGAAGYFARQLHAYGRETKPCDRCGSPIVRRPFMGRSAFFCEHCQPEFDHTASRQQHPQANDMVALNDRLADCE
ncbi:MAG: bifunctional DNA-formamidopyrimidine glycosylase/DNA-(apurinic or apyrimidinic site) lyase [Propionibacteriaceae bacterium]|jgi:formamidopyrimidine-DNA glycosylase|nr:bifunctional DNA-formamidopyrimidine glycosylase/DNA-(apurinic or apyrimidinic site) lyase [Propionibacteriaceae bacterium]